MSTYFLISGSSLTLGTTLPQTPTTPLCHAFLEGENTFIDHTLMTLTCMYMYLLHTPSVLWRLLASRPLHVVTIMWRRLVSSSALRLCLKSLIEVSYKILLYVIMSIPQFPGLNVVEVAHDMQLAVGRYVKNDLKLLNSFDTWHGTYQIWCTV